MYGQYVSVQPSAVSFQLLQGITAQKVGGRKAIDTKPLRYILSGFFYYFWQIWHKICYNYKNRKVMEGVISMFGFGISSLFFCLVIIILIWIFAREKYILPWQRQKNRLNHMEEEISRLKENIGKSKKNEDS
ncbi:MAG: hypothetical protein ABH870_08340 [bacterium]